MCSMYRWTYPSPLGELIMTGDERGLSGLWFREQNRFAAAVPKDAVWREMPVFRQTARWLETYFSGREPDFTPPLNLVGTPFQETVWALLLRIPYGATVSYGELARQTASALGKRLMAPQAVGGAVGRNPVSVIVPCHRVLAADGTLHGYGGGLERKVALLALEQGEAAEIPLDKREKAGTI